MWLRSSTVEESWSGMSKPLLTHKIISLEGTLKIFLMDANRNTHQQVLWTLSNLLIFSTEEVCALESFVAEKVVVEITSVVKFLVNYISILLDDLIGLLVEEGSWSSTQVNKFKQIICDFSNVIACGLVET